MSSSPDQYKPQLWEKIVAFFSAGLVLFVVLFLVIRNEKFADPNLVVLIRILVSFAVALIGAVIPGFLNINWSLKGASIRAGGALALLVLTFTITPNVLSSGNYLANEQYEIASDLLYLEVRNNEYKYQNGVPYLTATVYNAGNTIIDLFYMVVVMSNYTIYPEDLSTTELVSIVDTVNNLKPGETIQIGGSFSINNAWMENIPKHYGDKKFQYTVYWNESFDSNEYYVSSDQLANCLKERNCSTKLKELFGRTS